jgi:hypothetical protein
MLGREGEPDAHMAAASVELELPAAVQRHHLAAARLARAACLGLDPASSRIARLSEGVAPIPASAACIRAVTWPMSVILSATMPGHLRSSAREASVKPVCT